MARSYEAVDLVTLPVADAASTVALLTRLVTAARDAEEKGALPPALKKRIGAVATAAKHLNAALAMRDTGRGANPANSPRQREADVAVDGGWSALYKWLVGWSLLGDKAGQHAVAQHLLDVLFPDGLRFTQVAFEKEWAEVKWRLARVDADGLAAQIGALGGAAFLERVRKDHKAYGAALGITDAGAKAPEATLVREPLLAARKALRGFVLLASAHAEEHSADQALVVELLRPIGEWQGARAKGASDASTPPRPATPGETPVE